jgi:phage terminase large subunit GpA-like protein
VLCLVACIDTQDEALKYLVSGVGLGKELWLLEFGSVLGNLEHEGVAVYAELEERVLRRDWHCADDKVMRIKRGAWDAGGHYAGAVYEFIKRNLHLVWDFRAVESRPGTPIWKRGRSLDEHIPLLLGATTLAKDLLLNRLEIPVAGPGFIHVGGPERGFDETWAREMTAERKEIVFRGGIQKTVWRRLSTSQPNDAWDLARMTLIRVDEAEVRRKDEARLLRSETEQGGSGREERSTRNSVLGRAARQWGIVRRDAYWREGSRRKCTPTSRQTALALGCDQPTD